MNILSRSYIFYHGQNSFYYLFFFFSFHSLSLHGELLARQQQPGVLFGVTFQPAIEQPRGRHPSPRPLDVFTMNPYLPGCQCDIYVTRYCVSERVIEIFLAERASIPLAESAWAYRSAAAHTHARARVESFSFDKCIVATRNDPAISMPPDFQPIRFLLWRNSSVNMIHARYVYKHSPRGERRVRDSFYPEYRWRAKRVRLRYSLDLSFTFLFNR